ncbi:SubName: Full=Uncharacterized protein {ECO:0000313/EMBL:CCA77788.1} [Serendipita indica DSM 11827]|uniref:Mediator of RNA polymerase II transcription subunit 9 n=1 Tax=Serendipita indica (strain DSM 11827) TaxID=1109443 RepID=G4U2H7_SERID|nr:SubName: Full=Uncharacterized protein {ECO:0000313/EMBL:CCA77788.1} [Serendipita indica DSM 11827]CCA77788.1 hypothetical protein PIIN_03423 [Serendipita indica DSM 11827]
MATENPFPLSSLEGLIPSLLKVYAMVNDVPYNANEEGHTPTTAQQLVEATDDFKKQLQNARVLVENLVGGDLNSASQDEVIKMLEKWRDLKREQLQKHFTSAF